MTGCAARNWTKFSRMRNGTIPEHLSLSVGISISMLPPALLPTRSIVRTSKTLWRAPVRRRNHTLSSSRGKLSTGFLHVSRCDQAGHRYIVSCQRPTTIRSQQIWPLDSGSSRCSTGRLPGSVGTTAPGNHYFVSTSIGCVWRANVRLSRGRTNFHKAPFWPSRFMRHLDDYARVSARRWSQQFPSARGRLGCPRCLSEA
jgi:hypothetical protein